MLITSIIYLCERGIFVSWRIFNSLENNIIQIYALIETYQFTHLFITHVFVEMLLSFSAVNETAGAERSPLRRHRHQSSHNPATTSSDPAASSLAPSGSKRPHQPSYYTEQIPGWTPAVTAAEETAKKAKYGWPQCAPEEEEDKPADCKQS